jgi:predicted peptidase
MHDSRRFLLLLISILLFAANSWGAPDAFEARVHQNAEGKKLPYRLLKPQNYDPVQKYPLILFLHGAGARGNDNSAQISASHRSFVRQITDAQFRAAHPAFVVAPQCPEGEKWADTDWEKGSYSIDAIPESDQLQMVRELLDVLAQEFSMDPERLYITGLSMGGFGTWDLILRHPGKFAAAIPVCGGGDPSKAADIRHLPIWTFHGDMDDVVPVQGTREMVEAIRKAGGEPRYTEIKGGGHDAWVTAYQPETFQWLMQQKSAPGKIKR